MDKLGLNGTLFMLSYAKIINPLKIGDLIEPLKEGNIIIIEGLPEIPILITSKPIEIGDYIEDEQGNYLGRKHSVECKILSHESGDYIPSNFKDPRIPIILIGQIHKEGDLEYASTAPGLVFTKVNSRQTEVVFSWCPHPVTIDKSEDWGKGSMQHFPNGVFLKHDTHGNVTHGVQPNEDKTAPVGWVPSHTCIDIPCAKTCYDKSPIWASVAIAESGKIRLDTIDGFVEYEIKEPSCVVAQDDNGKPSETDRWVMTIRELQKSYEV